MNPQGLSQVPAGLALLRKQLIQLPTNHFCFHKSPYKCSDRLAIITQSLKRSGKCGRRARLVSAYFGFTTHQQAIAFVTHLRAKFPKAMCQVRQSQRLGTAIEVKVRNFDGLEAFAWSVLAQAENPEPEITQEQAKASIFPAVVDRPFLPAYHPAAQKLGGHSRFAHVSIE